jgi:alpha-beta hydrolase superfamily lysophospholipase
MIVRRDEGVLSQRVVAGPALFYREAMPEGCKAVVGLVHGYADHSGRYGHVMDVWAEQGIGTVAIDLRGHGRAAGTRGHCERFEEFMDDVAELAQLLTRRAAGAPMFLFGHSFGGLVATMSVLESPRAWRGLVLSSPYFGLALEVPRAKLFAGRLAARVLPSLGLPSGLKGADVTRDPVRARAYDQDPLGFKEARAGWFFETQRAQGRALEGARNLELPLYVVFGTVDKVSKRETARQFFDAAGSRDKTWDERVGGYHETWNDPEGPEVARAIGEWILEHTR